jgi:hypothetical protein
MSNREGEEEGFGGMGRSIRKADPDYRFSEIPIPRETPIDKYYLIL